MRGWDKYAYEKALDASGLPISVQCVLLKLSRIPTHGGDGLADTREVSVPALARRCGTKSEATIERALLRGEKAGYLTRLRRGRGKRTAYLLHCPIPVDNSPTSPVTGEVGSRHFPRDGGGTSPVTGEDFPRDGGGDLVLPFLTEVPSIVERVRARVRGACPDLTPDDDDLDLLIKNLENRTPNPVSNVAGYLQHCPPADIRRLLADAKPQLKPATTEASTAADEWCEAHDHPGGTTTAGTKRCPQCRRAAQHGRSAPFSPSLDGLDRPGGPKPADGLSEPLSEAVAG